MNTLETEIATFERLLPALLVDECHNGKFALIQGRRFYGSFDDRFEAKWAGHRECDTGPFLVRQILPEQPVSHVHTPFFAEDSEPATEG